MRRKTSNGASRGSILLYAMMTMAVMLSIGLTITGLFTSELRIIAAARDSVVALYASDSAAEMCLHDVRQEALSAPLVFSTGATYLISNAGIGVADCSSFASSTSFNFQVTGVYRGVRRTLEIDQ